MLTAKAIIKRLRLQPLDHEGGYFRRTVESEHRIENARLGPAYPATGDRPIGSVIQYLVTSEGFSAMHRVPTPETWFYHLGDPLEMLLLHPDGGGERIVLGPNILEGHQVQFTCPAHSWQGTHLLPDQTRHGYTLCSAALSPGFEWTDFELGDAPRLVAEYPEWEQAIRARVRETPPK